MSIPLARCPHCQRVLTDSWCDGCGYFHRPDETEPYELLKERREARVEKRMVDKARAGVE